MHIEVKGTTWQNLFLPSTVWSLGIELRPLGLVASPLSIETSCRTPLNIFTLLFCVFVCVYALSSMLHTCIEAEDMWEGRQFSSAKWILGIERMWSGLAAGHFTH